MLALIAPLLFQFDTPKPIIYQMNATFDGFLPLFGGNEGKAVVVLDVAVKKLPTEKDGTLRLEHELTDAKLTFNDAPLPFTVDNLRNFFPKTVVTIDTEGRTLATTAPKIPVPVRLPGLDVQRMADLVYLPVIFDNRAREPKDQWSFKKPFGESDVLYTCTLRERKQDQQPIDVKLEQAYSVLEDEALQVTADEKDAVSRVETTMTGGGTMDFDVKRGLFVKTVLTANAVSKVTDLKTKAVTERKLKIEFTVTLKK
jgi:hypothetical protein